MDKVRAMVKRKPTIFLILSLAYFLAVGFIKWQVRPPVEAIWFLIGGALGIYFLDVAEEFFNLTPSPFRTIVFQALFVVVSFFVVTSSGSLLASGLVLSLYLTMILWQVGEWKIARNLDSWYRMVTAPVSLKAQKWLLVTFISLFLVETFLFTR